LVCSEWWYGKYWYLVFTFFLSLRNKCSRSLCIFFLSHFCTTIIQFFLMKLWYTITVWWITILSIVNLLLNLNVDYLITWLVIVTHGQIVDFCCGANDFSTLMKKKLEETGKRCSYKNFDLLPTKVKTLLQSVFTLILAIQCFCLLPL
jgi:hypothetical protein